MPKISKPRLVNRGPAGLLSKIRKEAPKPKEVKREEAPINRIAKPLQGMVVRIDSLAPDPINARLHPERNLEAIMDSLRLYGQQKPLVVRKKNRTVTAGNGTLEAAKMLGWTKLAVSFSDLSEVEAAGYGLADNRTAELAKWDFEVVARLDKLMAEAGHVTIGWSQDELEVLRAADWTPPAEDDSEYNRKDKGPVINLTPDQYEGVSLSIANLREREGNPKLEEGEALKIICEEWND